MKKVINKNYVRIINHFMMKINPIIPICEIIFNVRF